jgi:glycolate oxidase iron-sulfur subunit
MSTIVEPVHTSLPQVPPRSGANVDYQLFLDCVHCGLCTSACPTYVELGTEMDSPRGRIYLMRAITDGRLEQDDPEARRHLDLCLDCRACETACPSGVHYGKLIEPFRVHLAKTAPDKSLSWLARWALFHLTPYARRMRWALAPARLMQWSRLDRLIEKAGLLRLLPRSLRNMAELLPRLEPHYGQMPEVLPALGKRRARVALFTGCAGDAFLPQTNWATAKVLQHNGCEVWIPRTQVCCGALHYHAGLDEPARQFASTNCRVFGRELQSVDAIIVNAAGCGAMLKDYGQLMLETNELMEATAFASKVRDVSQFLMALEPLKPEHPVPIKATYHDACHLCHAQHIRREPRQLLEMIPGLELLPLSESELCCGAAGSYNITQPEMAARLGERKADQILATGARAVFAGNVGCLLQIGKHLRKQAPNFWVAHPIDALWASYSGQLPKALR